MSDDAGQDDVGLVRAAQRGDRHAFGQLVDRHASSIVRLVSRMLGPACDAEDVAQDTFVAAYRNLAGFQFGAKFSTWLYGIAVNKCRDVLRSRRPEFVPLDDDGGERSRGWTVASAGTPQSALEQSRLSNDLDHQIARLPPHYRESFVLRHIEGLDYDQMSAILGVHRDTLKMRVYKARTALCRALAAYAPAVEGRRR